MSVRRGPEGAERNGCSLLLFAHELGIRTSTDKSGFYAVTFNSICRDVMFSAVPQNSLSHLKLVSTCFL